MTRRRALAVSFIWSDLHECSNTFPTDNGYSAFSFYSVSSITNSWEGRWWLQLISTVWYHVWQKNRKCLDEHRINQKNSTVHVLAEDIWVYRQLMRIAPTCGSWGEFGGILLCACNPTSDWNCTDVYSRGWGRGLTTCIQHITWALDVEEEILPAQKEMM